MSTVAQPDTLSLVTVLTGELKDGMGIIACNAYRATPISYMPVVLCIEQEAQAF